MRKPVLVVAVMLVLAVGLAWAGGEKAQSGKMDPAAHAAKLQEKLALTDAQTQQVRSVLEEFAPRFEALYAKKAEGTDISAEKKALKEEQAAKFKTIFTAEQWTRYQEMQAAHHKEKK